MKAKTIRIMSVEQTLQDFGRACHAASQQKSIRLAQGTFFTSISAARKVLTDGRIQLLKTIKQNRPGSLYELAKLAHKDFKNVSQDVAILCGLGLVKLRKSHGPRRQRTPTLLSDHIYLELAI